MSEKDIEAWLCGKLRAAIRDRSVLKEIEISNSTTDVKTLYNLVGDTEYREDDVICDDSRWNLRPELLREISGGMTPDVVLRSGLSKQNRLIIEVKEREPLDARYTAADSQVVRYFLHLLTTTETKPGGNPDMRRAVLLAAPPPWFATSRNA